MKSADKTGDKEITFVITHRGGPMGAIRLMGHRSNSRQEESFLFDHNLEGSHQLKPGHRVTFVSRGNLIKKVIHAVDIETGTVLPLEDKLPAEEAAIRREAKAYATELAQNRPQQSPVVNRPTVKEPRPLSTRPGRAPGRITSNIGWRR